jgi:hypothetical protein
VWHITTEAEVVAALKRNSQAEVYKCADDSWNILKFGRFHEIAPGLIEKMVADYKLTRRWPDSDACFVLPT